MVAELKIPVLHDDVNLDLLYRLSLYTASKESETGSILHLHTRASVDHKRCISR
jgi:hypothetical protein